MFQRLLLLLLLVATPAMSQDASTAASTPALPQSAATDSKSAGQVAAASMLPPLPATPEAIMAAAGPLYNFFSPEVTPWHMKVSYQLYDVDSKPTALGTFEYWRSSDKTYRRSCTRGDFTDTTWYVDGKAYWSKSGGTLEPSERDLILDLMPILPDPARVGSVKWQFTSKERKIGNLQLPCVEASVVNSPLPAGATWRGRDAIYCFDRNHPLVVALFDSTGTAISYSRLTRTQGLVLPRELVVYSGPRKELTAFVVTLESLTGTEAEFTPPAGLKPLDPPVVVPPQPGHVPISPAVAQGLLLSATPAVYPEAARAMRSSGTVVLRAVIGVDGILHDLSVVSGDKVFRQAALDAASRWRYRPYMLNGRPVEVDTTINVVFNLGGRSQ
jgi:TonB family protein